MAESAKNDTKVERESDRELVVTRSFNGPARIVFEAWTNFDLFIQWWVPKSFGITVISREADVRTGGSYRLVMSHPSAPQPMAFFGKYLEVTPHSRMVWTNEENGVAGAITTVTFEEKNSKTFVTLRDLYPTKEALDETMASGAISGYPEQFNQLDRMLATLPPGE
jgi:uncharacterized protein YndB with AHSA1/START domain